MKKVLKYEIHGIENPIPVTVPRGSEVLKVGVRDDQLWCWCLCDPDSPADETIKFHVHGTGYKIEEDNLEHVDSIFDGAYVWHIFKEKL